MQAEIDWHLARVLLEWQLELGATEAFGDTPIDRFAAAPALPVATTPATTTPATDPVAEASAAAAAAADLPALHAAMGDFGHCELRRGARNLVFADGNPLARLMIVGEAPGRDDDLHGRPFAGRAGQLLDRMLAAIGISRQSPDPARAVYLVNMLPWRPPAHRDPCAADLAMMRPFVERHIALVDPQVVVVMGRIPAGALLETGQPILRLRGQWHRLLGRPCLPMLHPADLLRTPAAKRDAWADLLSLQALMRTLP